MRSTSAFMSSLSNSVKWHGDHNENDRRLKLKAGGLSLFYENGNLRYLSDGKSEIIRMIYSAVRDKDWLTIEPLISDEEIDIQNDSFRIKYHCLYKSAEINFSAWYFIEGFADNTLIFRFEGEALDTFVKSRIGFCVLHPVETCSGKPCVITHSDGESETLVFPVYINPDQPFTDIKSMRWNVGETGCVLNFAGDVFESEDQRNWTDASYKTYCTPLGLPCPATIRKGEKISQRIEFKVEGELPGELPRKEEIVLSISPVRSFPLPDIGIGRSTRPSPLTGREKIILGELPFDHYRTDLYLFQDGWRDEADLAAVEAADLHYHLELALFFNDNVSGQTDEFLEWVNSRKPDISTIIILHRSEAVTPDMLIKTVAPALKSVLPDVIIGCGTNANYAQINRKFPSPALTDYFVYSVHPQEHASDNTTLVENLRGQAYTVESAKQLSSGKDIWVSPVNIQRRFNANIENYETPAASGSLPSQADTRIMSIFGACWTAISIKYLSATGAGGVTLFETAGERGIIQGDYDSRWPDDFHTVKGMIFPVYHLLKYFLKNKSFTVMESQSEHPLEVDCIALSKGKKLRMIAVNFTSSKQKIMINGIAGDIKIKPMNAHTYTDAVMDFNWIEKGWQNLNNAGPLSLEPYSLMFIEGFVSR